MTKDKFNLELNTIRDIVQIYCDSNHSVDRLDGILRTNYRGNSFEVSYHLCKECAKTLNYVSTRLENCVHEEKPKCRNCRSKCYDKEELKKVVKIMRTAGVKYKFLKLKNKMSSFLHIN